jgi:hypothetical protein
MMISSMPDAGDGPTYGHERVAVADDPSDVA